MGFRFDGKVAVVTGGAKGIGAATARVLCELGASVAIFDREAAAAYQTAHQLGNMGYKATSVGCDVSVESEVQMATESIIDQYGSIDILISNAGIQRYGNVVDTTSESWDEIFDVHVKGCYHTMKHAIPHMLFAGGGAIVVIGSVQSIAAAPNSISYVAAKHALLGLTRAAALDFARDNIRVNCVCPGSVDTPMLRAVTQSSESMEAHIGKMHALGRIGQPHEIARAIAFLASDWASFITGTSLVVDGGLLVPAGGMNWQDSARNESPGGSEGTAARTRWQPGAVWVSQIDGDPDESRVEREMPSAPAVRATKKA